MKQKSVSWEVPPRRTDWGVRKNLNKMLINGSTRLEGTIRASSAKNAVLPVFAASLLSSENCLIDAIPDLEDVRTMKQVLEFLGASVKKEDATFEIEAKNINFEQVPDKLMRRMRASNLVMGPLLARFGEASVSYPGGCNIGSRPMDLHLKGFKKLGAEITEKHGVISAKTTGLKGANINLDYPSVGATENIMMGAALARGITTIRNAAKEPEIIDLQHFLNKMGAKITGSGTDVIVIEGVKRLNGVDYRVIPDRIEIGTHMVAAAITGGDVLIKNVVAEYVEPVTAKLMEAGIDISFENNAIRVRNRGQIKPVDIKTMPYPGFPTDMQPQLMTLMTLASGTSLITETVFENRFKHADELCRLGARIKVLHKTAVVEGVGSLSGATVEATDLRAGAALVLAALVAEGKTLIENINHINRGYCQLEDKYRSLGANIILLNDTCS